MEWCQQEYTTDPSQALADVGAAQVEVVLRMSTFAGSVSN